MNRRDFLLGSAMAGAALAAAPWRAGDARADTVRPKDSGGFFRILTGSAHTTAFPVGVTVASAISNPPGSRPCEKGGSCGVPGLIAVALTSQGSVANLAAIGNESIESGFSQADLVYSAFHGEGVYFRRAKQANLRVMASLYPETIHLVVRRNSGIKDIRELAGKRISLDRTGSGTRFNAEIILAAYGLRLNQLRVLEVDPGEAADLMAKDELDAFFLISGQPAPTVGDLTDREIARVVPLSGRQIEGALRRHQFFIRDIIPANTYRDVPETETLSIGMQWIGPESLDPDLVYEVLRALWHPRNRKLLDAGPAMAQRIRLGTALLGVSVPLHAGAERYYREMKLIT
ncbi:MAG: TAXI family TRAP transporter solute-binding subunit [Ferrovibrio sp.]|uniref:TAXI family TRAP transporter solute-binding subunit n=1 Tax=Ferrovibrio sp. TaxID=1917215 RepID=UPI002637E806|nr:TAXI family TRAP transporter solute-binding subunit [Ferrovibrio sp.]MCW0236564.1 TAXI family TRAP transporter solute-binding subunit [Ferrovibrio sp.]